MVLPEDLAGPQTDADNRAWHEEINNALPALGLPDPVEGGTGHLDAHAIINAHVNSETGSSLPSSPAEHDPNHELHHNTIHAYVNGLGDSPNTYLVPDTIDSTGSTDVTVELTDYLQNTIPNGTQADPVLVKFPTNARYKMEGGVGGNGVATPGLELVDKAWTTYEGPVEFFAETVGLANEDPATGGATNNNRVRYHVRLTGGVGLTFRNVTVTGSNPADEPNVIGGRYTPRYEAQHCFDFAGSEHCTIDGCLLRFPWGDHVHASTDPRVPGSTKWVTDLVVTGTEMHTNGRQAVALTACDGALIYGCNIYNTRRATFDLEPDTDLRGCINARIENNTVGPGQLLFIANAGAWGRVENIEVINNTLTRKMNITTRVRTGQEGLRRRGPFTITGNVSSVAGQPPAGEGLMEFFEVDGLTITDNSVPVQGYSDPEVRKVYAIEIEQTCGLVASGNNWGSAIEAEVLNKTPDYICP